MTVTARFLYELRMKSLEHSKPFSVYAVRVEDAGWTGHFFVAAESWEEAEGDAWVTRGAKMNNREIKIYFNK